MFKYFLLTCLLFNASLSAKKKKVNVNEENNEKVGFEALKPHDVMPERVDLSQTNSFKPEADIPSCNSKARDGYQRCKGQYHEITKGNRNVRKICCALKTLQQCVIPVINENCSFEAFNDIESELHGINEICRIVGSKSCPRLDKN